MQISTDYSYSDRTNAYDACCTVTHVYLFNTDNSQLRNRTGVHGLEFVILLNIYFHLIISPRVTYTTCMWNNNFSRKCHLCLFAFESSILSSIRMKSWLWKKKKLRYRNTPILSGTLAEINLLEIEKLFQYKSFIVTKTCVCDVCIMLFSSFPCSYVLPNPD